MAAALVIGLLLLLSLAGNSDANYCVCNSGVGDAVLQKNIDYACGNGADCSAIQQNGPCFNPNTVKDHCNYAVNSYYQRKQQTPQSCDFQKTASVVDNPPSSASGCVFQSSPSAGGGGGGTATPTPTNPSLSPPASGTPAAGGGTTPTVGGTPTTTTPPGITLSPPGFAGFTPPSGIGLAPGGGGGFGTTDGTAGSVGLLPPPVAFAIVTLISFALVI